MVKEKEISKSAAAAEAEAEAKKRSETPMGKMLAATPTPPNVGDLIEGAVIAIDKKGVFVDLPPFGTGIIYGREYILARDVIKKINIGDKVSAKVVDASNKEGYIELSLKEARQALIWTEAEQAILDKAVLELPVKEANKGGLIIEWQGIQGFLPASQLKPEHYPRVQDGDKDRILEELKKLVGQRLAVSIIGAFPKEGKLIFSEKNPVEAKDKTTAVAKFKVGDEVEGKVTGTVDFGVFVKIDEGLEGLVHISEIDWALVDDPKTRFKVGDKVRVKVIEVKDGKVSLSIKALKPNPWAEAGKKYKKDMVVKGIVIKFNRHGALASIEEGVAGLVHVSEFGSEEKLRQNLELGKVYPFKITLFDAPSQKMTLSYAGDKK
ncbi:MAG: S1 RNA-binding domain-containing protein [Patescibacteria group bacterium]|nr:S1 RNA-binding domain-containing protein [Patescibacteria group bacterium]MDE2116629.1 S1 RNA-binding domain-containing protein [Patescibacteria group bacterium]